MCNIFNVDLIKNDLSERVNILKVTHFVNMFLQYMCICDLSKRRGLKLLKTDLQLRNVLVEFRHFRLNFI